MDVPDVSYARSGDVAIAYQVVGEGPIDLVFIRGTLADLLAGWDMPLFVDPIERLAASARVLLFDKRGSGLSDPVRAGSRRWRRGWTTSARSWTPSTPSARCSGRHRKARRIALLFAATYPERTSALVLYDPTARGLWAPDYPWAATTRSGEASSREIARSLGRPRVSRRACAPAEPVRRQNERVARLVRLVHAAQREPGRGGCVSPDVDGGRRARRPPRGSGADARSPPRRKRATRRPTSQTGSRSTADRGRRAARLVQLGRSGAQRRAPPRDARVPRRPRDRPEPDRVLATVLFTDIVGSTAARGGARRRGLARAAGAAPHARPRRARAVPRRGARHGRRRILRRVRRARPRDRVRVARSATRSAPLGLEVRAGVHTGECERVDGKLGGIAVPTGARDRLARRAGRGARLVDGQGPRRGLGDRVRGPRHARAEGRSGRVEALCRPVNGSRCRTSATRGAATSRSRTRSSARGRRTSSCSRSSPTSTRSGRRRSSPSSATGSRRGGASSSSTPAASGSRTARAASRSNRGWTTCARSWTRSGASDRPCSVSPRPLRRAPSSPRRTPTAWSG